MSNESAEPADSCLNCGSALSASFCATCGQKAGPAIVPLVTWLRESFSELLDLDGRALRTLRVLAASPGKLTTEWTAGRKARYTSPVRLYITASTFFFAASALPGADAQAVVNVTGTWFGATSTGLEGHSLALSLTLITLLPLFALVVMLTTRPTRPFLAHLVFTLHAQVVVFVALGLITALSFPSLIDLAVVPVLQLGLLVGAALHVLYALKKAYQIPLWRALIAWYFLLQANVLVADTAPVLVAKALGS